MGIESIITGGLGLAGSIIGGNKADKAAQAQVAAANRAADLQNEQFYAGLDLIRPQFEAGDKARDAMLFEMGLGPRPVYGGSTSFNVGDRAFTTREDAQAYLDGLGGAGGAGGQINTSATGWDQRNGATLLDIARMTGYSLRDLQQADKESNYDVIYNVDAALGTPAVREAAQAQNAAAAGGAPQIVETTVDGTPYRGFEASPGYQYQLDEQQRAIERSAAARGMQLSGATLKALQRNSQGLAAQEYGNYYNRLAGLAGAGQTATQNAFAGFQNLGVNQGNAAIAAGNARASGYNAQGNAIQGAFGNLAGMVGYNSAGAGGLFGGIGDLFGSGGGGATKGASNTGGWFY